MALSDVNSKRVSEILQKQAKLGKDIADRAQAYRTDVAALNTQIQALQAELENIKEA